MMTAKEFNVEREKFVSDLKDVSAALASSVKGINAKMTYIEYVELFQILKRYNKTLKYLI